MKTGFAPCSRPSDYNHARTQPNFSGSRIRSEGAARFVSCMKNQATLITGASSGIGLHLAYEFAKHGHPLVLVAPVESELERIAEEFRTKQNVEVRVIAKALREPNAAQEIFDEVQASGTQIEILVNNAGHGQRGKFWEIPIETDISMLDLNILAYLRLTKL